MKTVTSDESPHPYHLAQGVVITDMGQFLYVCECGYATTIGLEKLVSMVKGDAGRIMVNCSQDHCERTRPVPDELMDTIEQVVDSS